MKYDLTEKEVEMLKNSINYSDPFDTVKEAKHKVFLSKQRLNDIEKQLVIDEKRLCRLIEREESIKTLRSKLGSK